MRLLQIPLSVHTVTTVRLNWQTNYLCRFCWCAEDGSDVKVSLVSSWSWRKLDTVFNGQVRPGRRDKYHLGEEKLFNTIKVSSFFIVYFRTLQVDKNFGWFATKTCFDIVSFMFLRLSRLFILNTSSKKSTLIFSQFSENSKNWSKGTVIFNWDLQRKQADWKLGSLH